MARCPISEATDLVAQSDASLGDLAHNHDTPGSRGHYIRLRSSIHQDLKEFMGSRAMMESKSPLHQNLERAYWTWAESSRS